MFALCPEEAIKVEGEPLQVAEEPTFEGKIEIDTDLCIGCGRCSLVCPYQAVEVKKPFQGEIKLVEKNLMRVRSTGLPGLLQCLSCQMLVRGRAGQSGSGQGSVHLLRSLREGLSRLGH